MIPGKDAEPLLLLLGANANEQEPGGVLRHGLFLDQSPRLAAAPPLQPLLAGDRARQWSWSSDLQPVLGFGEWFLDGAPLWLWPAGVEVQAS